MNHFGTDDSSVLKDTRDKNINYKPPNEKYIDKNRHLKPVSHDYRDILHNNNQLNLTQSKQNFIMQLNNNSNFDEFNQNINQDVQGEQYDNQLMSPNGRGNDQDQDEQYVNQTFPNALEKSPIYDKIRKQHNNDNVHHNAHSGNKKHDFGIMQSEDQKVIRMVQQTLSQKEKNHDKILKMLEEQNKVVYKLVQRYQKRAQEEERILRQKMKEIEKEKEVYIDIKRNEEMLLNLQHQIEMRMDDYKFNQSKIYHAQISQNQDQHSGLDLSFVRSRNYSLQKTVPKSKRILMQNQDTISKPRDNKSLVPIKNGKLGQQPYYPTDYNYQSQI